MPNRIAIILFLFCASASGQKEAMNWYFGDRAGIRFQGPVVKALTDNNQLSTLEGCATISDKDGNLLFYTDGITIWNSQHQVMTNGNNLAGHPSSTQSAVIIPFPGSSNKYYVFTVDACHNSLSNGLCYSVVDLDLNCVTEKNILLASFVCEKITAVMHRNYEDIWVLSHLYNSNGFVKFLVTKNGIIKKGIQNIGLIHEGTNDPDDECGNLGNARGYLKASPKGNKIACAIGKNGYIELFDFNNATGEISNPLPVEIGKYPYGIEFSPSGRFLYASNNYIVYNDKEIKYYYSGELYQFDLEAGDNEKIKKSKKLVGYNKSEQFGALQLGPDGKIYLARYHPSFDVNISYLSVIMFPDKSGISCGFLFNGLYLGEDRFSGYGLPTFIQTYFVMPEFTAKELCYQQATVFEINNNDGIDSVLWDFGDGTYVKNNFSPAHTYPYPGNFEVSLTVYFGQQPFNSKKRITIKPLPVFTLGEDRELCQGQTVTLSPSSDADNYNWSNGLHTKEITLKPESSMRVSLQVEKNGCTFTDEIEIKINHKPFIQLNSKPLICGEKETIIEISTNANHVDWQCNQNLIVTNENDKIKVNVNDTGTYSIRAIALSDKGCQSSDSVKIEFFDKPRPDFMIDTLSCNGFNTKVTFTGEASASAVFNWNFNGSEFEEINKNKEYLVYIGNKESQRYSLFISYRNCYSDTNIVTFLTKTKTSIKADRYEGCLPLAVVFSDSLGSNTNIYEWDFGDGNREKNINRITHIYNNPGIYHVKITVNNEEGCKNYFSMEKEINVSGIMINDFSISPPVATTNNSVIAFTSDKFYHSTKWFFGDGAYSDECCPLHTYSFAGNYEVKLIVESEGGCKDSVIKKVEIFDEFTFFAPNAFNPNSNVNENRYFMPKGKGITDNHFQMLIYDRWGNTVFTSRSVFWPWDGNLPNGYPAPMGNYLWAVSYYDEFSNYHQKSGLVTLIRE